MTTTTWKYPPARRSDHVDVYESKKSGQVRVPDPYEWLEHKTEETEAWIDAEVKLTKEYLSGYKDHSKLASDLRRAYDYAKFSSVSQKGDGRWYWYHNAGLDPHMIMYRTKGTTLPDFTKSKSIEESSTDVEVFFDPNLLSDDKTAAIQMTKFSPCGKYFAFGISRSGSDFSTIYVRPTDSPFRKNEDGSAPDFLASQLSDELRFVKFSGINWTADSKGFFYSRYPDRQAHGAATEDVAGTETEEDKWSKVYYHRVGTPQSEDILVVEDSENPYRFFGIDVSDDGKYLILSISQDTAHKYKVWVADVSSQPINKDLKWIKFADEFEHDWTYIANIGSKFIFKTDKNASKQRIISVDVADPTFSETTVVPEDDTALLQDCTAVGTDYMVLNYSRNVKDEVYLYTLDGKKVERIAEDFIGTIGLGRPNSRDQTYFTAMMMGFTSPGISAFYDFSKPEGQRWVVLRKHEVGGLNPEDFLSEQVWFPSKDGTKVPMFIVRHKDTPLDGTAPAFQYGYGGFAISIPPRFSSAWLTFAKRYRAVIASVNLRGGNEFGEEWHQQGMKDKKMNVFDDFIAASQYLVENKFAAPGKVIINGGSNGGLLVAACVNIAPEGTFGAAIAEVGVLDMLKFHKFTVGKAWTADYGDPSNPEDFDYIYPYSPLHNVPPEKELPPTMLMTADHDDRVVPLHSFKHAAQLQYARANNRQPLLIRIEQKAGHGAGKSTDKIIGDAADRYGFAAYALGLKYHDG
ncbi:hypothetical protein EXIGLDRAFT_741088 [Exidia glandulosa HHB12029]|uniref:Prolyl endopeptidase n=1 Tax=Exidia glandulosa HHB12029 TaxID=1314781 RepID=A0A165FDM2_EXIGL|nr:hypothetical protein EXIGLDRAFT_741088 [Exidia glandulosa HHB12029]